jgi:hypothetical protein
MGVLAAKLLLAPTFVACASLAARRYGAIVGGIIGGLPVVAGPILFIFTLDHGNAFGSRAAAATLLGLISLTAFVLVYGFACRRFEWQLCLLSGWAAFLVSTAVLSLLEAGAVLALVLVFMTFALALVVLPPPGGPAFSPPPPPSWDLPLRALSAMTLVVVLTGLSSSLGAQLSGMLAPFPIIATVLAAFTHAQSGSDQTLAILRGLLRGFFSFGLFCFTVSVTLRHMGVAAAFLTATTVAVAAQSIVLWLATREQRRALVKLVASG